ncbi:PGDYG protein [Desulfuromusa kysingii]|uniref:PGDYG protein n=1 Tax=Desulfuromusa kysingii TaxID=37625 RepID=A0A1H3YZ59_9BACT|nr:PGDYG domain-containing protein [Desulfuromusa kysingii]SEA16819.1 PGDYG protein [Desulfuromusa kysingii]
MIDLASHPHAIRVLKRPIPVNVDFADKEGVCKTLEGSVRYQAGDAILTGNHGDTWPVERDKFFSAYRPVPPLEMGNSGHYTKKPASVFALQASEAIEIAVGEQNDLLQVQPGDWIIEYSPGDYGVVKAEIFYETYEPVTEK